MILDRATFDRVLALPDVQWDKLSADRKHQVGERCLELYQQLHRITGIESVRKLSGAMYLYEQALTKTLELLGVELTADDRDELLLAGFMGAPTAPGAPDEPPFDDFPY